MICGGGHRRRGCVTCAILGTILWKLRAGNSARLCVCYETGRSKSCDIQICRTIVVVVGLPDDFRWKRTGARRFYRDKWYFSFTVCGLLPFGHGVACANCQPVPTLSVRYKIELVSSLFDFITRFHRLAVYASLDFYKSIVTKLNFFHLLRILRF